MTGPAWLSGESGDWRLSLWIQPGASRSEVAGEHDGCLKLRIAAPATDGRANLAICRFLAERLAVPRAAVRIDQGDRGRRKRVRVAAPCDAGRLRILLRD
jgi:uncharacterized protein (TIGR00251 family)